MAVLPAIVLVALKVLGIHGVLAGILVLQAAMPSLASAAAYASRFGGNPEMAGEGSFWTSLASIVTIPAFLLAGGLWGLF
jgi:predicted permease